VLYQLLAVKVKYLNVL